MIPLLGAMALGAQRLLPALQQIYSGWASLKGYNAGIQAVLAMLKQPLPSQVQVADPLQLREGICFAGVHFRYGPEHPEVLRGLELEIRCGERIGLIGSTGSGKSTTVDLLMGLLTPTDGRLLVDGADLHDPAVQSGSRRGGPRSPMCRRTSTWLITQLLKHRLWCA